MAKKIRRSEFTFSTFWRGLLHDPQDINSGFKDSKPTELNITLNGQLIGKERSEARLPIGGVVFLHFSNNQMIRVKGRDLSPSGIGVLLNKNVTSYRIGSKFGLEFAQPHRLQGVMFQVELRRVYQDSDGHNQIGFKIVSPNRTIKKKVDDFLHYIKTADPWA